MESVIDIEHRAFRATWLKLLPQLRRVLEARCDGLSARETSAFLAIFTEVSLSPEWILQYMGCAPWRRRGCLPLP